MAQIVGVEMTESCVLEYWDSYVQSVRVYHSNPTEENKKAAKAWFALFEQSYIHDNHLQVTVH